MVFLQSNLGSWQIHTYMYMYMYMVYVYVYVYIYICIYIYMYIYICVFRMLPLDSSAVPHLEELCAMVWGMTIKQIP